MTEHNVGQFEKDILANDGYLYTTNARKSSLMANQRLSDITREMVELRGRRVVDVGAGDGTYTYEIFAACKPAFMVGVDAAANAINTATRKYAHPGLRFERHDVYSMPYGTGSFDVAIVRGLLHHLDDAPKALEGISRLASEVFLIEPNGYSPILKLIERVSRYHREHCEKSYAPGRIRRWIKELGGTIEREQFAGIVPMFCPDWMAEALKAVEPVVEPIPVLRQLLCAVFAVRYRTGARD
jgi:2-polyprenyl-3-methyl-5-hydroxy-6-metoxy-1,4-benzoquinol methylase